MSDEFYLPDAKLVYKKIIDMGSKEVLPFLGLGNIALHSGDLDEAEKWFVQARNLQADHPAVLLARGRLIAARAQKTTDPAAMKKQLEEARALLEKSKLKGEDSATVHSELGAVYYKLGVWERQPSPTRRRCACADGAMICASLWDNPMRSWVGSKKPSKNIVKYYRSRRTMPRR